MCHRPLSEILKGSGIGVQGDSFLMTADIVIDRIPGKKLKNVSMSDSPSSLHIAPFAILTAYDYQQQVQLLLGLLWRFLRLYLRNLCCSDLIVLLNDLQSSEKKFIEIHFSKRMHI